MDKLLITFSDGSTFSLIENQLLQGIHFFNEKDEMLIDHPRRFASKLEPVTMWSHVSDGLIPSFLDLISNSAYFFDPKKPDVMYSANSIVRLERA
jgi:hypothetical protein